MKVGLFDHVDQTDDRSFATQLDERLAFVQAADAAGFARGAEAFSRARFNPEHQSRAATGPAKGDPS